MKPRKIRAGTLDRRCSFYNPTITRGTSGSANETWTPIAMDVPCSVEFIRGKEKYAAESQREVSIKIARFTTRYFSGITKRTRISYEGENWDIITVAETGRREGYEIEAQIAQ